MKRPLLLATCALAVGMLSARQAYFQTDFSEGMPQEMGLYDVDGNEPSSDMKNLGFEVGVPWIVTEADKDGNLAACSTSWYKTAGTSNDWMITPMLNVDSEKAVLRWRAKSGDKDYRDGYLVLISETGNTPDDFDTANPALTVKSEKNDWTDYEISLADFVGKSIWIAFVNNSKDKMTLYIDDIMAGVPSRLEIKSSLPRVIEKDGKFVVSANITNTSAENVNEFTIKYSINGGEIVSEEMTKNIGAGRTVAVNFSTQATINKNETLNYIMWVEVGEDVSEDSGKISAYSRRVVAEEVTGTWCGYCIRGMVAMKEMKENYGDSFLGIAVHAGSNNWADPMDMSDYTDWLFSYFVMSGYPHAVVDRLITLKGDPQNLYYYYTKALERDHFTGLDLTASVDRESRVITANTTFFSARNLENANLRLAYVILENDVHGPEVYDDNGNLRSNGWEQSNYYSGGSMGPMGGYEDMPSIISGYDMWYQDVARYITPGYSGIEGSLPSTIEEGVGIMHEEMIEMPETILNDTNTDLAVLLINGKTNEILNAEVISLSEFFPSSVKEISDDMSRVSIRKGGEGIIVSCEERIASATLYSIDGRIIAETHPMESEARLAKQNGDGFFILRIITESGKQHSKKIKL